MSEPYMYALKEMPLHDSLLHRSATGFFFRLFFPSDKKEENIVQSPPKYALNISRFVLQANYPVANKYLREALTMIPQVLLLCFSFTCNFPAREKKSCKWLYMFVIRISVS